MRTYKKSSNSVRTPLQKEEINKLIKKKTKLLTSRKGNNQCSNNTEILKRIDWNFT